MISNVVKEYFLGFQEMYIKVTISKILDTDMVKCFGLMAVITKDYGIEAYNTARAKCVYREKYQKEEFLKIIYT